MNRGVSDVPGFVCKPSTRDVHGNWSTASSTERESRRHPGFARTTTSQHTFEL